MKIKAISGAALALALGLGGLAFAGPASATETECVPRAAYTETITEAKPAVDAVYKTEIVTEAGWQRYSYTGNYEGVGAPEFPGDNWQPNVAGDPHKVGKAGAYHIDRGAHGEGDWFYLEAVAAVTKQVLVTEAIPATPAVTLDHVAVTCEPPVVPEPTVVVTTSAVTDCETKMTTVVTTTTTSGIFHLEGKLLVADEDTVVETSVTRDATAEECVVEPPVIVDPPVVVIPPVVVTPPVVTPPAENPVVPVVPVATVQRQTSDKLAYTGYEGAAGLMAGAVLLSGGIILTAFRMRARKINKH